jgi:hypothetical protein
MRRLLDAIAMVLGNERVVGVLDTCLISLGLGATTASLLPAVQAARIAGHRRAADTSRVEDPL